MAQYSLELHNLIDQALHNPKNLATESELTEQANCALAAFREADVDSSESLTIPELVSLCSHMGLPMENDEEEALMKIDADDSGQISVEEWITWWLRRVSCLPNPLKQQEAIAKNTFKKFDIDDSGSLDTSELHSLIESLGVNFSEDEMSEVIKQLDSDGSGIIELEEFTEWWVQRSVKSRSGGGLIAMKLRKLARKAAQLFFTDIFTAVWNDDLNLVKTFLESDRRIGNASDVSEYGDGWTPLHYASYKGHLSIAEELIENSANVNATNDLGYSALFYACQQGHLEVCKLLLDRGGDPSICGNVIDTNSNFFMCPVDHYIDSKDLLKLLKAHPTCAPPKQPPADKMRAFITEGKAQLSVELPPLRSFSILPIKKWNIELNSPNSNDSFEITVNGLDPNKWKNNSGNILEVLIDKKWVNSVYLPDGALPELTVKLSAINSLDVESPFTDNIPVTKGDTLSRHGSGVLPPLSVNFMAPLDAVEEDDDDDYNDNFEEKENDFEENDETIEKLRREINGEESGMEDNGDDFEDELVIVKESPYK